MEDSIQQKLRIETGAAAPDSELQNMYKRYMPSVWDSEAQVKDKLERLNRFMEGSLKMTHPALYNRLMAKIKKENPELYKKKIKEAKKEAKAKPGSGSKYGSGITDSQAAHWNKVARSAEKRGMSRNKIQKSMIRFISDRKKNSKVKIEDYIK